MFRKSLEINVLFGGEMVNKVYRLGCDIGGTFTDFVLLNDETGEIKTGKCLTTPRDPSDAVEEGMTGIGSRRAGLYPQAG